MTHDMSERNSSMPNDERSDYANLADQNCHIGCRACGLPKHVGVTCAHARIRAGVPEPVSGASQLMGKVVTPVVTRHVTEPATTARHVTCKGCIERDAEIAALKGKLATLREGAAERKRRSRSKAP